MDCAFCKIITGSVPCFKIWEDADNLAFLNIQPIKTGHTLVIPRKHYEYLFELDDEQYQSLALATKTVAGILKKAFSPKSGKIGQIVYGMDIAHVHIHLSPIDQSGDLSFSHQRHASNEELALVLEKIKEAS